MAKGNKGPRVEKSEAEKAAAKAAKAAKFVDLAKKRTSKAIKSISLLENLSGSGYIYTQKQTQQIIAALDKAVGAVAKKFDKSVKTASEFDFSPEASE